MLYPLSYEGGVCAVSCANMALRKPNLAREG